MEDKKETVQKIDSREKIPVKLIINDVEYKLLELKGRKAFELMKHLKKYGIDRSNEFRLIELHKFNQPMQRMYQKLKKEDENISEIDLDTLMENNDFARENMTNIMGEYAVAVTELTEKIMNEVDFEALVEAIHLCYDIDKEIIENEFTENNYLSAIAGITKAFPSI